MRLRKILSGVISCIPALVIFAATFMAAPRFKDDGTVQVDEISVVRQPVVINAQQEKLGQIVTARAVIYSDTLKTSILEQLKKGDLVTLITEEEKWCQVRYRGQDGYIESDYIVEVEAFSEELFKRPVIVVDAGHQGEANIDEEPVGPGSNEMKVKVTDGTTGIKTGVRESDLNLQIALLLENELENRGYTVIQIRQSQDVDISNKERSEFANEIQADIFLRIHANGSESSGVNGAQTICPEEDNPYLSHKLYLQSYLLSLCILDSYTEETGCNKEFVSKRNDMTGINWSKVPVTIIEMGYMSNPEEDLLMQDKEYQRKMVNGIANGVDEYFQIVAH